MSDSFSVLIASKNDHQALLVALESVQQDPLFNPFQLSWTSESFLAELKIAETLICKNQTQEVLSFLSYRKSQFEIEIMVLATLPQYRNQGLQQKLLKQLLRSADHEKLEVWLEVHEKNSPAIELYKKNNFSQQGLRTRYYKDGADALLMKWSKTSFDK